MDTSAHRWRRSAAVGVAAASLGLTGLLGLAATPASAGARSVTAHVTPAPLDHMLCYHVRATGFKPPANVLLKNFIQVAPFAPAFGAIATHCNPAIKQVVLATGGTKTYKVLNPRAHLLCWTIAYKFAVVPIVMSDQFGTAIMQTSPGPRALCVPSWKKRAAPPHMAVDTPPKLDHFTCYGLVNLPKPQYGFRIPPVVKVQDEFSAPRFTKIKLGIANTLCVPTTKVHNGKVFAPQTTNDLSLVCYPSTKTPYWKSFFDQNQFGTGMVLPTVPVATTALPFEELCVPSTARLG